MLRRGRPVRVEVSQVVRRVVLGHDPNHVGPRGRIGGIPARSGQTSEYESEYQADCESACGGDKTLHQEEIRCEMIEVGFRRQIILTGTGLGGRIRKTRLAETGAQRA